MNGASDSLVPRKRSGIKNDKYFTLAIQNMHVCTKRIPYSHHSIHVSEIPSTMYVVVSNNSYVVCIKLFNVRLILEVSK